MKSSPATDADIKIRKPENEYDKNLFALNKINSTEILDTLQKISDTVLKNTTVDSFSRKGDLYINLATNNKYLVYEYPGGGISGIIFYKGPNRINAAEYYPNGQLICNFSVTEMGVRNGVYYCYTDDGKIKSKGLYINGEEISDSTQYFDNKENRIEN